MKILITIIYGEKDKEQHSRQVKIGLMTTFLGLWMELKNVPWKQVQRVLIEWG